jgi:hypothetical protein
MWKGYLHRAAGDVTWEVVCAFGITTVAEGDACADAEGETWGVRWLVTLSHGEDHYPSNRGCRTEQTVK